MKHMHRFSLLQFGVLIALLMLSAVAYAAGDPTLILLAPAAAASVEELAAELKTRIGEVEKIRDNLQAANEDVKGKAEKAEGLTLQFKRDLDEGLAKFNAAAASIKELEQKLAERAKDTTPERELTWGEQFVGSDAYKARQPGERGQFRAEVKAVTSTAAGGLIRSQRESGVLELARERRVIRDLLTVIPTNTSSIDYAVQSTRTNNAAPVAESAAKPYSDYAWSSATVVVRTLAHLAKITRQAMDDAPRLIGEIDSELRYGLGLLEERQFLSGTGVGQNLHGIIPQATAFAAPGAGTVDLPTNIDVLRLAILQAALTNFPPDGIVLNPLDWGYIELTKTTDGAYLFANPQGSVTDRMWNLPVVSTPAMTAGDFLVGAFKAGATVYDRMGVEVLISTENVDDFEKNLATMRCEERVAIAVKRPDVFITGDFAAAVTAITAP